MRAFPARLALIGAALLATLSAGSSARARDPIARYTAFAVNLGSPGRAAAGPVEIAITRWSTTGERDRLLNVLFDRGPDALLDTLNDTPRIGYIRTPDSIGYDLRFAQLQPAEDAGEHVTVITDRYITFWEAYFRPRTIDYPFTVIELHLDPSGHGEGKMSLATRITGDKRNRRITLEDYATQPVLLQSVRKHN